MYSPPESGFIAPSSAYVTAPNHDSSPPTIHTRKTVDADPVASIMRFGTRKMPLPMMTPTTIAPACSALRSRTSPGRDDAVVAGAGPLGTIWLVCVSHHQARKG